ILHAVNALDLDHVNELENFADIDYINEKIATTQFIEKLFESNRIHTGISSIMTNEDVLNTIATQAHLAFDQFLGIDVDFTAEQFRVDGEKYGIYTVNASGTPVIKVSEIKQFILSATATNWLELDLPTNVDGILDFVNFLLEEDTEGVALIDEVFSSKILMAVLDKAINLETNELGLREHYATLINRILPDLNIDLLDGFELTEDMLVLRGVSDLNGVLKASEFRTILDAVVLLDIAGGFSVDKIYSYINTDANNNGVEDFEDLFQSNILLSILTNALSDPQVIDIALEFLEPIIEDAIDSIDLLDGLDFDLEALLHIPSMIVDAQGQFDYMDVRSILTTLERLGIERIEEEFADLPLDALTILARLQLGSSNGARYLAETKTVRYLVDYVLKQEGVFDWALSNVSDIIDVDVTGLDLVVGTQYDDVTGVISVDHFYQLLLALGAVDINGILNNQVNLSYVYNLLSRPFMSIPGDRLAHIYNSQILTDIAATVVESEEGATYLANLVNEQIEGFADQLPSGINVRELDGSEFGLSFELVNEASIRGLITAVKKLGFESFDEFADFTTVSKIANKLDLENTDVNLMNFLEVTLIQHAVSTVLLNDLWSDVAAQFINTFLEDFNFEVQAEWLALGDEVIDGNGRVASEHIYQMIVAAYVVITADETTFTPKYIEELANPVKISGITQSRLDHILDSRVLFALLDTVIHNEELKVAIADFATEQLSEFGVEFNINPTLLTVPGAALDETGSLKRSEIHAFFNAFVALEMEDFSEFNEFVNASYIYNKVYYTTFVDRLLDSEWIHNGLTNIFKDENSLNELASFVSTYLEDLTGVAYTFSGSDFDITAEKYNVIETIGLDEGLLRVAEVKKLILAATRVAWMEIEMTGDLDMVDEIFDALFEERSDTLTNIEFMLDSKILMAVFDKVLNLETNEIGLRSYYTEVINSWLLPSLNISLLDDVTLSNDALVFRGISNARGVLMANEIIAILQTVRMVGLDIEFNEDTIFTFLNVDTDNNGVEDFLDLFQSRIILSVVTNA
ncbi:MAG: hypothetical protein IH571_07650, partial [Acholeplasmataceae bacterium]|nr:hypothetical protein [Acholeplasmataceae bacterium]